MVPSYKNIALLLGLLLLVWTVFIYLTIAQSAPSVVINPGPEYSISVGGQSRILRVFYRDNNLILRYFRDNNSRLEFLGEEIFDKDDIKVYDSYIENNGMWPAGYERRYRR